MTMFLKDRVALITGSSRGLGRAIAEGYVKSGASVILCARNREEVFTAKYYLSDFCSQTNQKVIAFVADVSKQEDVENLVNKALNEFEQIHILVNNAGIYGTKGRIEDVSWKEWVRTIEINLFGSVLMTRMLLPHFRKNRYGKIIQVSGGGATAPMPFINAYATSKAAVVRFAETISEEVKDEGIDINSISPGALNTRLLDEILEAGFERVGYDFYKNALEQKKSGGTPLEYATELSVFLASELSDGITGKLISAKWDNWGEFHNHIEELNNSDVYTLRRIVGKDRNMGWGDR